MDDKDDQDSPGSSQQFGDSHQRIIELLLQRRDRACDEDPLATLSPAEKEKIRLIITELKLEHRDLDIAIRHLAEGAYLDEIQLRRMKKRKLYLKDIIARLGSSLIPDLDA